MSIQVIERNGKPECAVVPYDAYLQLVEQAEMLQDIRDYDSAKVALEHGEEELIPSEVVYALLDGQNPIKIWQEYRRMAQAQLAEAADISIPYLSQLEAGKRKGSTEVLNNIAKALKLSLNDIVIS
jgi:DNA-binding XRE family transcriptional regulator